MQVINISMNILPNTMSAVVLRGQGSDKVFIQDVPVPKPGPNQILARVDSAGICASLIKTIDQGGDHPYFYGRDLGTYPAILGDEGSVTLVQVGDNLKDQYRVGSRYVVQPAVDHPPVTHLDRYEAHGEGINKIACGYTLPGLLGQFILLPEEVILAHCLVPVPNETIPYAHAAIAEPFSCCLSGQHHHMHLTQDRLTEERAAITGLMKGGVTAIIGLGAMGRMHVEMALQGKPRVIIGSDPNEERCSKSKRLFAKSAESKDIELRITQPEQLTQTVAEVTGGRGVNDLIIAVGSSLVIESSLPLLAKRGVASLFGGLKVGSEFTRINANAVHYGETCITGSSGGTAWDIQEVLRLMASGNLNVAPHIAKIGGMRHALQLIDDVRHQRLDGKAVLYPHHPIDLAFDVTQWTAENETEHLA